MKRSIRSMWRVGIALILIASLSLVFSAPAAVSAGTANVMFSLYDQAGGLGTACWSTTQAKYGTESVELHHLAAGAGSVYFEFVPNSGVTLADLDDIDASPEWSFWHYTPSTPAPSNWVQMELRFTSCYCDNPDGAGHVDVTLMALQNYTGTDAWVKQDVTAASISAIFYGNGFDGSAFSMAVGGHSLSEMEGMINTAIGALTGESASTWELTRVRMELWESIVRTCYIDNITIAGTTYPVEYTGPDYYLEPDIAYNIKTATETFTAIGPCGPIYDPTGTFDWSVVKGCGTGDIDIVAGGGAADNYITVRMNTKGDAHICVVYTPYEGDPIELCSEKKWGEIYCTELVAGDLVDDECCVTEYVDGSFLWDDCTTEVILALDSAKIDWWLMSLNALTAVQALEAALGTDVCDVDGGCGGYEPGFFSYDVDGDGIDEVYNSPADALAAIYAQYELTALQKNTNYIMPDVTLPADPTHETTTSKPNGQSTIAIHTELTAVMLVSLTDYPIDKHGENTVCVQHETWIPTPPAQVKIPQVAWAGEKIVLEKKWGTDFTGKMVMFKVDQGSIGVLIPLTGVIVGGNEVWTAVGTDGVARCILESEYEGQAEVKCTLYNVDFFVSDGASYNEESIVGTIIGNHDFPVFFIKLESVEAIGDYPDVAVDHCVDFGIQVKGWFITGCTELAIDPATGELRAAKPVDADGDGTPDFVLPEGRWVLPDDWPRLAGIPETRTHWDLMDNKDDNITSTSPLGPFDTDVVTTDPPGEAEKNVVGPFNTTQPVAIDGEVVKWVASASVVGDATLTLPDDLRDTVVPNGILEWQDCPMPAAYLQFIVSGTTLTAVPKYWVDGYYSGTNYTWPFYFYEIPSSMYIPVGGVPEGYRWDSWGTLDGIADGPYPFWGDLGVTAADTRLEVYTDNNGRAYVTMDALSIPGTATINAIADYPYQRKHPAIKSATTLQTWYEPSECVDEPAVEIGLASVLDKVVIAYGYKAGEGVGGWTVYDPAYPASSDLTTLYVGRGYWIYVSAACTLDYGVYTYDLDAGWNLIGWLGCGD